MAGVSDAKRLLGELREQTPTPEAAGADWQRRSRILVEARWYQTHGMSITGYPRDVQDEVIAKLETLAEQRGCWRFGKDPGTSASSPELRAWVEVYRRAYRLRERDLVLTLVQRVEVELRRQAGPDGPRGVTSEEHHRWDVAIRDDAREVTESLTSMLAAHEVPEDQIRGIVPELVRIYGRAAAKLTWADMTLLGESMTMTDADVEQAASAIAERLGVGPIKLVPRAGGTNGK